MRSSNARPTRRTTTATSARRAAGARLLGVLLAAALLGAGCARVGADDGSGSSSDGGGGGDASSIHSADDLIEAALGDPGSAAGYHYRATGTRHEPGQGRSLDEVVEVSRFELELSVDLTSEHLRLVWGRTMGERTVVPGARLDYVETVAGSAGYIEGDDGVFGIGPSRPMNSSRLAAVQRQQLLLQPHLAVAAAVSDGHTITSAGPEAVEIAGAPSPTHLRFHPETGDLLDVSTVESDPLLGDIELVARFSEWEEVGSLRVAQVVELAVDGIVVHRERREDIELVTTFDPDTFALVETVPVDAPRFEQGWTNSQWFNRALALPFGSGFADQTLDAPVIPVPVAPEVIVVAGTRHNTVLVGGTESVVVIEPSINADRSRQILDLAAAQFPGRPVSHVVLTHDHHDQIGGVREVVAAGATVVLPAEDEEFIRRVLQADRTIDPDTLTQVGTGADAEIAPVPEEGLTVAGGAVTAHRFESVHDEHMLVVCIPAAGLAFNSDLYNPGFGAPDAPLPEPQRTFARELLEAIEAACPATTGVLGSHGMPDPAPLSVLAANAGVDS